MDVSIASNVAEFTRDLDRFAREQIPYATALALNDLARGAMEAEREELKKDFPTATPFTMNALGYVPAKKNMLMVTVFVKDIQAVYLEPYAYGGQSIPAGPSHVAMVTPKNIGLNQYGNIPYRKVASLKGRADVFSGTIKTKAGSIGGVFQRLPGPIGPRLKVLVRFTDPHPVKEIFEFEQRALSYVAQNVNGAMERAMTKALSTMR